MELGSEIFTDVLSPLAAFAVHTKGSVESSSAKEDLPETSGVNGKGTAESSGDADTSARESGEESLVLDDTQDNGDLTELRTALANPKQTSWRLDGADVDARRFFAYPPFAIGEPPLRIDVYLPPLEEYPPNLRKILRPEAVAYTPKKELSALAISRYVLQVLDHWSSSMNIQGDGLFEQEYRRLPFGSQILINNIDARIGNVDVTLLPNYEVEQNMLTVEALQRLWDTIPVPEWPPIIDLENLAFERQLHEAITLVRIPSHYELRNNHHQKQDNELFVFKSLLRDQRFMYNELKTLLSLRPHDNLISKPLYVVTKKGRFGGRNGVCGFVIQYYPLGTLKDRMLKTINNTSGSSSDEDTLETKLRWARQITEALIHINSHKTFGFYPDLKPDNVVLRPRQHSHDDGQHDPEDLDAVLLDLEQRGGWFSWSPPEVAAVEYLEILATSLPGCNNPAKQEIAGELRAYIPGWRPTSQNDRYRHVDGGFSAPWVALLRERNENKKKNAGDGGDMLEKAQVFMLGKLIWSIFEDQPYVRCGIDHEVLQDGGDLSWLVLSGTGSERSDGGELPRAARFPEFTARTPMAVRELVRACTAGAPEWDGEESALRKQLGVVLCQRKLVPARDVAAALREGRELASVMETVTPEDTRTVAREYWTNEVEKAREVLRELNSERSLNLSGADRDDAGREGHHIQASERARTGLLDHVRARPGMAEVFSRLEEITAEQVI